MQLACQSVSLPLSFSTSLQHERHLARVKLIRKSRCVKILSENSWNSTDIFIQISNSFEFNWFLIFGRIWWLFFFWRSAIFHYIRFETAKHIILFIHKLKLAENGWIYEVACWDRSAFFHSYSCYVQHSYSYSYLNLIWKKKSVCAI